MSGSSLKRLGLWVIVLALAGMALAPSTFSEPEAARSLLRHAALAGAAVLASGFVLDLAGRAGRACARCGRPAARGSVFCHAHRQELTRTAHDVAVQHGRDNRNW